MTDYPTGSPSAGWYTDPADATQERWWGGAQWTHDTRPLAAPAPAPVLADAPGGGLNPFAALDTQTPAASPFESDRPSFSRGANDFADFNSMSTSGFGSSAPAGQVSASWYDQNRSYSYSNLPPSNGFATAGLVLALVGANLLGLIFSIVGLRRAREFERGGELPVGRKRSRWGLALSIISMVLSTALLFAWLLIWPQITAWLFEQQYATDDSSVVVEEQDSTPVVDAAGDGTYDRAAYEQEIIDEYAWEEMGTPLSVTCPDVGSTAAGSTITCEIVLADRVDTRIAEYYENGGYMISTSSIQQ